jgi:hypothetical protein
MIFAHILRSGLGAVALFAANPAVAIDDEQAFVLRYRCAIETTLRTIYAAPIVDGDESDRFFILDPLDHRHGYVQCALDDRDAAMLCEAASGYYDNDPGAPRAYYVTGDRLAELVKLGFSDDDSKGNYVKKYPILSAEDFGGTAELALRAMYRAFYGARGLEIRILSPYLDKADIAYRCQLMS